MCALHELCVLRYVVSVLFLDILFICIYIIDLICYIFHCATRWMPSG